MFTFINTYFNFCCFCLPKRELATFKLLDYGLPLFSLKIKGLFISMLRYVIIGIIYVLLRFFIVLLELNLLLSIFILDILIKKKQILSKV